MYYLQFKHFICTAHWLNSLLQRCLSENSEKRKIDWLSVLNAQAAIFQFYPGDVQKIDDKIDVQVNEFWLSLEIRNWEGGRGRVWTQSRYTYRVPQSSSSTCGERGIFPDTLHHCGLWSGSAYYLVAYYDKLSDAVGLFFFSPVRMRKKKEIGTVGLLQKTFR